MIIIENFFVTQRKELLKNDLSVRQAKCTKGKQ